MFEVNIWIPELRLNVLYCSHRLVEGSIPHCYFDILVVVFVFLIQFTHMMTYLHCGLVGSMVIKNKKMGMKGSLGEDQCHDQCREL